MHVDGRYIWEPADLETHDVPESAKAFLATRGLPAFVGTTTIEFGPYDSPDHFVIGQDYDYAIYLAPDGTVWHDSSDGKAGDQFMNSSVEQLDRFIDAFLSFSTCSDDATREEIQSFVQFTVAALTKDDPAAFANQERWVWPLIWEGTLGL